MKNLKGLFLMLSLFAVSSCASQQDFSQPVLDNNQPVVSSQSNDQVFAQSFNKGGQQPQPLENAVFNATVIEKLPDDNDGLKHELFRIKFTAGKYAGKTAKVAHDTTYAPYVPLNVGDNVEIKGDLLYAVQPEMVLHWTHKSDNPKHPSGYIKVNGKVYE